MKRLTFATAILALVAPLAMAQTPAPISTWTSDAQHSEIDFSIRHLSISNVRGRFGNVAATLVWNEANITRSRVTATIGTATVDTGEPADCLRTILVPQALRLREAAVLGNGPAALATLDEHRLLCAHRRGPYGIAYWNRQVERWLAEQTETPMWATWYVGRPLLVTANDYGLKLYNGDTGVTVLRDGALRAVVAGSEGLMEFAAKQFDPSVSWKDLEWIRGLWQGPLVIKGLVSAQDAARAAEVGIDAVVLSNHGGRQLDQVVAPLDMLPEVRERVGADSGIRRGSDIALALALGADAVLVGRPYLYGLGAAGERGVVAAIAMLGQELRRAMTLMGVTSVAQLRSEGASLVRS